MTSIIKNQIVKHLSKFAKNITPDQISLDVLKGKSELKNIVLNEEVLTEVLELPVWLRIRKATCNRVAVKIQWMKLKSAPIELFVDEIQVEIILTSEKPPPKKKGNSVNALSAMDTGSYGFANKVVEGMSLYVNTLEIHFDSGAFGGSFMLSRLSVDSRTPGWQHPHDLRYSRISCPNTNRTIMYKQISWQLLRIEASAHNEGESAQRNVINAPLRLITSNGRIRIALKKNSTDGAVIHARIMMILEDILWVATLPQLQSAIAFYSHIMKLVKASQGFGNVEVLLPARTPSSFAPNNSHDSSGLAPNKNFAVFDFNQTSYHLNVKKIDLHLCDDAHSPEVYPPQWDIESGAMQVTLHTLLIDVYPKTPAASDRAKWVRYSSPNPVTNFLEQNLKHHFARLIENTVDETTRVRLTRVWPQLMSFNVVFRVLDMSVQCVSDMQTKRDSLFNMFESDSEAKRKFPGEQFVLHAEFANFFHPMSDSLPVPPPLTHVQLGPFMMLFDKRTIRWILYVAHHLTVAISQVEAPDMEPLPVTDLKLDLLMPKIVLRLPDPSSDSRLPHRLTVCLSTLSISNRSTDEQNSFTMLDSHLMDYLHGLALPAGKDILRSDLLQMNSNMTVSGLEEGDQLWITSSPLWVETDHGPDTKGLLLIADVPLKGSITVRKDQLNIFVEPQTTLSAIVDHFQLLQLIRLSDDISKFADLIATDQKFLDKGKKSDSPAPAVIIVAALAQAKVHLLLTHGPMPSPYEACPAINEPTIDTNSYSQSDSGSPAAPSTPQMPRTNEKAQNNQRAVNEAVEEFPEFPTGGGLGIESDLVSQFDETMSVTTDISDDDAAFMPSDIPVDDPFGASAEIAEEAMSADTLIRPEKEDRHYKSLMAKNVNVLHGALDNIAVVVSIVDGNTLVQGKAQSLRLHQEMNKLRSDVCASLSALSPPPVIKFDKGDPKVVFTFSAPSAQPYANLDLLCRGLDLKLEDEIIAHLSAFVADEQVTENKLRFGLKLLDSKLEINDPKKKKPMRISLKEVVIEQDED